LDEALNRRISVSIEFPPPDHSLRYACVCVCVCMCNSNNISNNNNNYREKIWRNHIPKSLKLHKNVDLNKIALDYELVGGFIKQSGTCLCVCVCVCMCVCMCACVYACVCLYVFVCAMCYKRNNCGPFFACFVN